MGVLSDDVTRLSGEIRALHKERETFRKDLADGTKGRASAVSEMRAGFFRARSEMAHLMKADLAAFTTSLKREVGHWTREVRADLAGARRAWCGKRALRAAR